jgi:pimeloyl-ACP methyl ester carboxylesterase
MELTMNYDLIPTSDRDTAPAFDPATFWAEFRHDTVTVNGVRLHYVEGGNGKPLLLLPGWPQSWYAWRYVMPLLTVAGRRVIALDPRGTGDSDRPASGYDLRTVTSDIHELIGTLGLTANGPVDVVGHDVGTWIGYAYAADWPDDVKRLAVFDASVPGVTPPPAVGIPSLEANLKTWHFGFNRLDDLPELLLQGREREFLSWLFRSKAMRPWTITPADLDEYVRVNSAVGAIRTALAYYRHVFSPEGLEQNRSRMERQLQLPILAFGADKGVGTVLVETMRMVAAHVRGGVFQECGHYMPEEAPRSLADQIINFMGI